MMPKLPPQERSSLPTRFALLAAGACLFTSCLVTPSLAQWADDAPEEVDQSATTETIEPKDIDWSILNSDPTSVYEKPSVIHEKTRSPLPAVDPWSWTRADNDNGSSAVTIKQPISPIWDARIGADLNVATTTPTTSAEVLTTKLEHDNQIPQSTGSAWASLTAPGLGRIWDKTSIEARSDPAQEQSKFSTSMSKSVPFGDDRYSLTLQNGYNVTQQTLVPVFGFGASTRVFETDQSAKIGIAETGTSFIAGQTHSTSDNKWLHRIGAEQKLPGGVTVTGSVSETPDGTANRSLMAGFKTRW